MANLSLLDLGFVLFESDATPLHISGLVMLSPPAGEVEGFGRRLVEKLWTGDPPEPPFDQVLDLALTRWPRWRSASTVDLGYHVRHSQLPEPGNPHQLLELISRIHSYRLDRSRPLWELWVIDGLESGEVALVVKIHHSLADGVRASKLFARSCSLTPDGETHPFWVGAGQTDATARAERASLLSCLLSSRGLIQRQIGASIGLAKLAGKLALNSLNLQPTRLKVPFTAPRTPFNISPDRARTVALASLPLRRFSRIAKLTGTTANDVMLTVCDMALHRYLQVHNWSSRKPMVALMPINLRRADEEPVECNKISLGLVELGQSDDPPLVRLGNIRDGTMGVKQEALELSGDAYYQYSIIVNGLALTAGRLGLHHYLPPATNMLISNVPGPTQPLYYMGAEVTQMYPLSLLLPGQTLNITLLSYAGQIHFGLVCCRRSLPGFDAIADYLHQSLTELEQATLEAVTDVVMQHTA
ncbi:wax ester/triacylglycerol synthase family O-acyltransferase [Ferrimonas balearica]|uniref:wax ester/triacylglycerol synthase family O-acyltransferase n=1 Tax=Ferrimonas balearica TaxID=44012 RepID=UPI001C99DF92|nr:wax ester/triacylglycerol synthase family O-acyltransferase [Ferrimonas balearica]MBY5922846.1 wax ester/triacylglycerol synthase family O-acyltransferase [Ferrimonas balearica]MBY5997777.1 wax ester/triacylglycerol synthase family O-acyltransferase [Ferrimonas balearica]